MSICSTLEDALRPLDRGGRVWSTGAYITENGRFLFAGGLAREYLLVFAVGGRVEEGETLLEALRREGREEAGIDLVAVDAHLTCFLLDDTIPERVVLPGGLSPRPALVWTGPIPIKGGSLDYLCAAWKCRHTGQPAPAAEIDRLLWIDQDSLSRDLWGDAEIIGGPVPAGTPVQLTGTAARATTWLRSLQKPPCRRIEKALTLARDILSCRRAPGHLVRHSEKVTSVALAVGRRLRAAGHSLDLAQLGIAAMCHDVGRTDPDPETAAGLGHAAASARILERENLGHLAPAVTNHILPAILNPGLRDDLLEKVLFYADKVVGLDYMGIHPRLDEFCVRRPDLRPNVEETRAPLVQLENELAGAADLTAEALQTICYLAALSEIVAVQG